MGMTDWLENRAIEDAQSRGHAGIWGFFKYDAPSSDVAKALATAAIAAGVLMAGVAAVFGSSA